MLRETRRREEHGHGPALRSGLGTRGYACGPDAHGTHTPGRPRARASPLRAAAPSPVKWGPRRLRRGVCKARGAAPAAGTAIGPVTSPLGARGSSGGGAAGPPPTARGTRTPEAGDEPHAHPEPGAAPPPASPPGRRPAARPAGATLLARPRHRHCRPGGRGLPGFGGWPSGRRAPWPPSRPGSGTQQRSDPGRGQGGGGGGLGVGRRSDPSSSARRALSSPGTTGRNRSGLQPGRGQAVPAARSARARTDPPADGLPPPCSSRAPRVGPAWARRQSHTRASRAGIVPRGLSTVMN